MTLNGFAGGSQNLVIIKRHSPFAQKSFCLELHCLIAITILSSLVWLAGASIEIVHLKLFFFGLMRLNEPSLSCLCV